jgi:Carboxypeptidase regulatory-like domain/Peptidase family M1 domain
MKKSNLRLLLAPLSLAVLIVPFIAVHGAGGRVQGKVTDPKGAIVVGAKIKITNQATNQPITTTTDSQGHYEVNLPAGVYSILVSGSGFSDFHQEGIKVADGGVATIDVKLEVPPVEAAVTVFNAKGNTDPAYQQLRQIGKQDSDFAGPFATVHELVLKRDAAFFTLHSGEIYFSSQIEGHVTAAVFIGEGELSLTPPTPIEKHSLAIFTNNEALSEGFSHLVIRFTDKTFDEIKASTSATMGNSGGQAARARDLYRDNQQLLRKELHENRELRSLMDVYAPQRPGYFTAFIAGKKHEKLVFLLDPLGIPQVSPEEVALFSYGESDGGIWTAFHLADEYRQGTAASSEDHRLFDITRHEIDGSIKGTQITATDRVTFRPLVAGRVLSFELYRTLRVSRVQDGQGKDVSFIQEGKDDDADFGVIMNEPLELGRDYTLTIQYSGGDALRDSGGGNYILIPRSSWYPNNGGTQFGDRATFDITFHYPKGHMFVATGAPIEPDKQDGGLMVARWSSGQTELAVAGFNFGRFKKKELLDKDTGYNIEFYANTEVPDEIKQIQQTIDQIERAGGKTATTLGSISTTAMADQAIADAENSTRIYNAYFGKLPYTRVAMTQQPAGFFGQAWPTLVFMPYIAFIDSTQRSQLLGTRGGNDNFWRYVAPHEIAHQWWGHTVGWDSYHDQWMSEGFAEFSASLYVQFVRRDPKKFLDFWDNQRDLITQARPATHDIKPYTIGPVTQGYRLSSGKTRAAYQFLVYPKGAYILHMIRMMFYNGRDGDQEFQAMMKDFVQTNFNRDVSTEDFKRAVEKHMIRTMDLDRNQRLDWFFNEWVYGTEIPSYRFEYQLSADGKTLSGQITQSGVTDGFKMVIPLYGDFGNGWIKLGSANLVGNSSVELKDIKLGQPAKRASICAMDDVLALSIQNGK